ncbi:hypothetical protein JTE90_013691 [Oedothorax gibbosus]|uniref:Transmembrane protein 223 n=1 Tax=Oedothorax gibbosus TaxID=931172 RepID=A0AAV6UFH8_9ARAC|nr:hypothetical protein JTE90_013691 [Oedothorax gibbosus]
MDKLSALPNDVLLYTFEKSKIIRYFTIFGVAQFGICAFLGGNIFVSLKDTANRTISDDKVLDAHSWRRINFGDMKYRIIAGLSCFSIGVLIAYISYALPQRIVKELTLHRGGKLVSITTYAPLGRTNHFQVPLQQMNCTMSRSQAKSYVPIKIKNKWFYYLMDCKGQFHQPQLFDLSVGAKSWEFL